ncbi:hypothetical protein [Allostreptomyces psammosilenae]|uniref:Uncharacterized protein n=1 Tax=Allostreptomyces psammosilenae TaxID=1892865 RepID=A0A852ZVV8_9ACTN|nr:hypothetical protein [Allostreptomyces psammosilenae]NYI06085.1 hypothetical protein [Allostreptomyces psammosilenae]
MALYTVRRTDMPNPGEFVDGLVIAGGKAQARKAFYHMSGVTSSNLVAERVDTACVGDPVIMGAYWDERDPESGFPMPDPLF